MPTRKTPTLLLIALSLLAILATLVAAAHAGSGAHLDALQRMTGSNPKGGQFTQLISYLNNLQAAILPIAAPVGTLGIVGGGVAYMLGHHMAQKILGGVIAGAALVLLAPQLMA